MADKFDFFSNDWNWAWTNIFVLKTLYLAWAPSSCPHLRSLHVHRLLGWKVLPGSRYVGVHLVNEHYAQKEYARWALSRMQLWKPSHGLPVIYFFCVLADLNSRLMSAPQAPLGAQTAWLESIPRQQVRRWRAPHFFAEWVCEMSSPTCIQLEKD